MKRAILFLLLAGMGTAGCQQNSDHHKHPRQAVQAASPAKEEGLRLDDRRKWQANPETTEGVREMQKILQQFREQESEDFTALHESLEFQFEEIIRRCTMKGEAHQQLHHFLEPLMGRMRELKEAQSPADQQRAAQAIEQQLSIYADFFQ